MCLKDQSIKRHQLETWARYFDDQNILYVGSYFPPCNPNVIKSVTLPVKDGAFGQGQVDCKNSSLLKSTGTVSVSPRPWKKNNLHFMAD